MLYGTYNDIPVKISRSGSDKYCIEPDGVAMFAAYNKFLRIYHSRVSSVLNEMDA